MRLARTCARAAASRPALTPARDRPQPARSVPFCTPQPRSSRHVSGRPTTSRHCRPTAPPLASAAQATSARQLALGAVAAHPLAPAAIPSLAMMPYSYRRRSSATLSAAAAEPPRLAYIRSPELIPACRQSQAISLGPPLAANRLGEVSFPISGNRSCRHCPGHSGATRASPSPVSPPEAFSSSREPFPLLDFDREPPQPQNHFTPAAAGHREARRRQLTPSPLTQRPPGGPPQSCGSIPTLGGPRGAA